MPSHDVSPDGTSHSRTELRNWEEAKDAISSLYITQGQVLEDVRDAMRRNHNFDRSIQQYKRQFQKWGFVKYAKGPDYSKNLKIMARKAQKAKARGKVARVYHQDVLVTEKVLKGPRAFFSLSEVPDLDQAATPPDFRLACSPPASPSLRATLDSAVVLSALPPVLLFSSIQLQDIFRGRIIIPPSHADALLQQIASLLPGNSQRRPEALCPSSSDMLGRNGNAALQINLTASDPLLQLVMFLLANKSLETVDQDLKINLFRALKNSAALNALIAHPSNPGIKALLESVFNLAVEASDVATVRRLLENNVNDTGRRFLDHSGSPPRHITALEYCFEQGKLEIAELLLQLGCGICELASLHSEKNLMELAIKGSCSNLLIEEENYEKTTGPAGSHADSDLDEVCEADDLDGRLSRIATLLRTRFGNLTGFTPGRSLSEAAKFGLRKTTVALLESFVHSRQAINNAMETCLMPYTDYPGFEAWPVWYKGAFRAGSSRVPFPVSVVKSFLQAGANPNAVILIHGKRIVRLIDIVVRRCPSAVDLMLEHGTTPTAAAITAASLLRNRDTYQSLCKAATKSWGSPSGSSITDLSRLILLTLDEKSCSWLIDKFESGMCNEATVALARGLFALCRPEVICAVMRSQRISLGKLLGLASAESAASFLPGLGLLTVDDLRHIWGSDFYRRFPSQALHAAVMHKNTSLANHLIQSGLKVNAISSYPLVIGCEIQQIPDTALTAAIRIRHEPIVRRLLEVGADMLSGNETCPCGHIFAANALVAAVESGDESLVAYLLDKGADVHAFGVTLDPLSKAPCFKPPALLEQMNRALYPPNCSCTCITPLGVATRLAVNGEMRMLRRLVQHSIGHLQLPAVLPHQHPAIFTSILSIPSGNPDSFGPSSALSLVSKLLVAGTSPFDPEAMLLASPEILKLLVTSMTDRGLVNQTNITPYSAVALAASAALAKAVAFGDGGLVEAIIRSGLARNRVLQTQWTCTIYGIDFAGLVSSNNIELLERLFTAGFQPCLRPGFIIDDFSISLDTFAKTDDLRALDLFIRHGAVRSSDVILIESIERHQNHILQRLLHHGILPGQSPDAKASSARSRKYHEPGFGKQFRSGLDSDPVTENLDTVESVDCLQAAVLCHNRNAVRMLIAAEVDVNAPGYSLSKGQGATALQCATMRHDHEIMKLLIDHGADVNAKASSYNGMAAVQLAAVSRDLVGAELLISSGAHLRVITGSSSQGDALHSAVAGGSMEMVKLVARHWLQDRGKGDGHLAQVAVGTYYDAQINPLELAAYYGYVDILRYLSSQDQNFPFDKDRCLKLASGNGHLAMMTYLLEAGADANGGTRGSVQSTFRGQVIGDSYLPTALQLAAANGSIRAAEILLQHKSEVNAPPVTRPHVEEERHKPIDGTALEFAAERGSIGMVGLLLEHGAEPGRAVRFAEGRGHHAIGELIRERHPEDSVVDADDAAPKKR